MPTSTQTTTTTPSASNCSSPIRVITEVVYLLGTRLGHDAEVRFLGDFAGCNLIPEHVAAGDWLRIAELVQICSDL
jgi:uncharacterized protein